MVKKITTLNIDSDIVNKAKKQFINMSDIAERAIKDKLGIVNVEISEALKCEFCGQEIQKTTKDDLNGLVWLFPDEKWICPECLRSKINKVISGKNV